MGCASDGRRKEEAGPAPGANARHSAHARAAIHHRATDIRPSFERIFGYDGYGCHEWEINALVRAEAEGDARALAIVSDLIARRGSLEARALEAEPLDEDTDTRKPARKDVDDGTIF